jgi:hypothetical protein
MFLPEGRLHSHVFPACARLQGHIARTTMLDLVDQIVFVVASPANTALLAEIAIPSDFLCFSTSPSFDSACCPYERKAERPLRLPLRMFPSLWDHWTGVSCFEV